MNAHQQVAASDLNQNEKLAEILKLLASLPAFDWHNYKTAKPFEKNIPVIEKALLTFKGFIHYGSALPDENRMLKIAAPFLQMGAYHLHITRNAASAFQFLYEAKLIFAQFKISHHDYLGWTNNHLALLQQQNFKEKQEKVYAEQAIKYCDDILKEYATPHNRQEELKIQAFAYVVKARTLQALGNYKDAAYNYYMAMRLYEYGGFEIQHADIKSNYACMLAENNDPKAEKLFAELDDSWINNLDSDSETEDNKDDYCFEMANFMESYGNYLLKRKADPTKILEKFESAFYILEMLGAAETQQAKDIQATIQRLNAKAGVIEPEINTPAVSARHYDALGLFGGVPGHQDTPHVKPAPHETAALQR